MELDWVILYVVRDTVEYIQIEIVSKQYAFLKGTYG